MKGSRLLSIVITLLVLMVATGTHAAPPAAPLPRDGSCPSGYYSSGDYCVPSSSGRFAVVRRGSCPSGYYSSGNYCVASSDDSHLAILRSGSCPSGYYSSGDYCVSSSR